MKFNWVYGVTNDPGTDLGSPNLLRSILAGNCYRNELIVLVYNMEGSVTLEREEVTDNSAVEHDVIIWWVNGNEPAFFLNLQRRQKSPQYVVESN